MWWDEGLIIEIVAGSRAYGLEEDESDEDVRGVALPPREWLVGFAPPVRQHTYASQEADRVVHALPKFLHLALNGNPNMLDILFCAETSIRVLTVPGRELRAMRGAFLSKRLYAAYAGYASAQLKRMHSHNTAQGSRGRAVQAYGYDPKNAMHLLRLLLTARRLFVTGELQICLPAEDRTFLRAVRRGEYTAGEIQQWALEWDAECGGLARSSRLPDGPDFVLVQRWLERRQSRWICRDASFWDEEMSRA